MTTYQIKTHNPWTLLFVMLISMILPLWLLLDKFGTGVAMIVAVISFLGSHVISYYLLVDNIEVTITDKGIKSSWMRLPFFSKTYKEILWTDIEYWNFVSSRMMDAFIIKTKDKETFSIRCSRIYSTQPQLADFFKNVTEQIDLFNQQQSNTENNIKPFPSIFARKFGIVFAIIVIIVLICLTYILITTSLRNDSAFVLKAIFVYLLGLTVIGFVVAYQLIRIRRNRKA